MIRVSTVTGVTHLGAGTANESFEHFVREHCTQLVQSLSLIVLDPELAADAAQDAFVKLYQRWDTVGELEDPVAWLYRVALNRCSDYRRRLLRRTRLLERLRGESNAQAFTIQESSNFDVERAFRALPIRQRTAATLFYLADFKTEEVARAMGVSKGTVDRHLNRAREALRASLEAHR